MEVYNDLQNFKAKNTVVTVGAFDGIHAGHKQVLDFVKKRALERNAESVLFTFNPLPKQVLFPESGLQIINTYNEKIILLNQTGINHVVFYQFNKDFAKLTACEFVKKILKDKLNIVELIVGFNHSFGSDKRNDLEFLTNCGKKYNFDVTKLPALVLNNETISSTRIRELLLNGEIEKANQLLGYEYTLSGTVVRGQQIGRTIGFPTANILPENNSKIIPGNGVYAVKVFVDNKLHYGMLNIGTRPTVNNNDTFKTIEVNILNFNNDIYNKILTLTFCKKIRNEKKFNGLNDLKQQISSDKEFVLNFFNQQVLSYNFQA